MKKKFFLVIGIAIVIYILRTIIDGILLYQYGKTAAELFLDFIKTK